MVNKKTVIKKLCKLKTYLQELRSLEYLTWEEYKADFQHRRTVERLIQLIVDVAVDINTHTVVDEGAGPPKDAFSSFLDAANLGMIPNSFADKIAPSTGERNILVHEYEQIDDAVVYRSIKDAIKLYEKYIIYVTAYLESKN